MEDKELQQLFDAKRTADANLHRQKELIAAMRATGKHTSQMWPVWAGAVAASIALVLLTLPDLLRGDEMAPMQVVELSPAEIPTIQYEDEEYIAPIPKQTPRAKTLAITEKQPAQDNPDYQGNIEISDDPVALETPEILSAPEETTEPAAPRIHRRRSTRMISAPNVKRNEHPERSDFRQMLADAIATPDNSTLTIHTFELS